MDRKNTVFYGEPLNKSLNRDDSGELGPINARKARARELQTVRDAQGRQRFHGAFTGGFSAGYYNTVGSIEGFQPRQFVARNRSDEQGSSFSHKPEDYMDEEDLGEFGIAPRKVRLIDQYKTKRVNAKNPSQLFELFPELSTATKIDDESLKKNIARSGSSRLLDKGQFNVIGLEPKDNYHGIGYESLNQATRHKEKESRQVEGSSDAISAVFKDGRRIKISGEAFGSGILDDDQDLRRDFIYGIDNIQDYNFERSIRDKMKNETTTESSFKTRIEDPYWIDGFILSKSLESFSIGTDISIKYPPPVIDKNWVMPVRNFPLVSRSALGPETTKSYSHPLEDKFSKSTETLRSDDIETKPGLSHLSELKKNTKPSSREKFEEPIEDISPATIIRTSIEWRPCSLLCKRFNVPNPFPDNLFSGIKPSNDKSEETGTVKIKETNNCYGSATIEMRQSIFNIEYSDKEESASEQDEEDDSKPKGFLKHVDDEDQPQVVEIPESYQLKIFGFTNSKPQMVGEKRQATETKTDGELHGHIRDAPSNSSDDDDCVLIVPSKNVEPEVIVLSSSDDGSSRSLSLSRSERKRSSPCADIRSSHDRKMSHTSPGTTIKSPRGRSHSYRDDIGRSDDDNNDFFADTYGPPLPPKSHGHRHGNLGTSCDDRRSRRSRSRHKDSKNRRDDSDKRHDWSSRRHRDKGLK